MIFNRNCSTESQINIVEQLQSVNTPVFIYVSNQDRVSLASSWDGINRENIDIKTYDGLNHIEMLALLQQEVLVDFASDLLQRQIDKSEIETVGILCEFNDEVCLSRIPD